LQVIKYMTYQYKNLNYIINFYFLIYHWNVLIFPVIFDIVMLLLEILLFDMIYLLFDIAMFVSLILHFLIELLLLYLFILLFNLSVIRFIYINYLFLNAVRLYALVHYGIRLEHLLISFIIIIHVHFKYLLFMISLDLI